jgi:hypothetical protein
LYHSPLYKTHLNASELEDRGKQEKEDEGPHQSPVGADDGKLHGKRENVNTKGN